MSSIDPESYYNDVILRPVHKTVRSEGRNVAEVEVEDEQLFLERQMGILTLGGGGGAVGGSVGKGKTPASDKRQTSGGGGSSISGGVTTGGITTPKKVFTIYLFKGDFLIKFNRRASNARTASWRISLILY